MAKKRRSKRKRRRPSSEELYRSSSDERTSRRRERRGVFPRKLIIGFVLLAVFVFFLPAIVVRTPLKQIVINRVLADFQGNVTVESITCGWITSTELRNVVANDANGDLLFSVKSLSMGQSLTSMIGTSDYGTIEIVEPVLNLKIRPDGSNLEDAISDLMTTEESDTPSPAIRLAISDARALVTDTTTGDEYEIRNITSFVEVFQPDEAPLRIGLTGRIANLERGNDGSFNAKIAVDAGKDKLEFQDGLIELTTESLPIEFTSPLITRFIEPMTVSGTMNGAVNASWRDGGSSFDLRMEPASIAELVVNAPRRIGNDQIRLTNAWLQGNLAMTPQTIEADRLVCQTEVGSLKANGKMNWEQIAAVAGARIPANNFQAEGLINLAPLIAMLPETFPLQEGMRIESGTVRFNANSRIEGTDRRMVMNLESAGLTAIRDGQRINWDKPARIVAAIRQTSDNAMYIESLDCKTNFLTLNGTATSESGAFEVQGDLKSALAEVNQFFDLRGMRVEGIVDGKFAWQFDGSPADKLTSRPLRSGGRFHVEKPLVHLPGQTSWSEEQVNVVVQAAGQLLPGEGSQTRSIRLDTGKLELVNERQSFEANLVEAIVNPSLASTWKLDCKVGGNVENWLAQLATFVPVNANATGIVDATALMTVDPAHIDIGRSDYEFTDLEFTGYGLTLNEKKVGGEAALSYAFDTGVLQISNATVAASALSARAQQVVVNSNQQNGSFLSGQIAFLADINRCLSSLGNSGDSKSIQWFGRAEGTINLNTTQDTIGGKILIKANDLVAAQLQPVQPGVQNVSSSGTGTWSRLLEEKEVTLESTLQMSRSFDKVILDNTRLIASAAEVVASGSISDFFGTMNTDIQGTWNPDWRRLKPLLESMLGGLVSLDGVQGGGFRMSGPIFNPRANESGQPWIHPELQIVTAASWQSGQVLGLPIGGSSLDFQLAEGIAAVNTDAIAFSGGTARLSPRLDLRGPETVLYLPQGNVLEQVELTPEICRGWLKFVAPMIADATAAHGKFSVATGQVNVPLNRLEAADLNGVATIHGANVGPGPLGQQLIMVVAQVKALAKGQPLNALAGSSNTTWLKMPEQQVSFAVQKGRVHHQEMQFQIDDVVIQTSGSVGLDQTIQLVAKIPVLDQWVGNNRWTQGLKGQTLQIPISGTVSSPRVDNRGLQQMSQQLVKQAAGAAINNEVQGLIDKGNQRLENELKNGLKGLFGSDK